MDEEQPDTKPTEVLRAEHPVSTTCGGCGTRLLYRGRGRPRRYCSDSCRTQGWALRRATTTLKRNDTPPVVEVRERVIERHVRSARPTPVTAREWCDVLTELQRALTDNRSPVHREHWKHRKLYDDLLAVVAALDQAHPGGVKRLGGHR